MVKYMLALVVFCFALVGCASSPQMAMKVNNQVDERQQTSTNYEVDWAYVTKIERLSRSALVGKVIWINPPLKKPEALENPEIQDN